MTNEQLLEIALKATLKAGDKIMQVYAKPFKVNYKEDDSPVTEADSKASKIIVEELAQTQIPVISEEENIPSYEERKNFKRMWLVDPIDGTKEFVKKNGEFSVNIGLIENNFPLLGVVYMPVLKEIYFAAPSIGSYKITHDILTQHKVEEFSLQEFIAQAKKLPAQKPHKYTVVASRSHLSKETFAHLQNLKYEKGETDIVYSGSSVKMCWVAEGRAHQYPRFGRTMEWDTAAGQAIVENAGGTFLNFKTKMRLDYNKKELGNPDFIAFTE
ncbi:MAG TPA: 3'(2'),5'-bisphosphate nucleotidase CysQ [Bacteroidia bacterium]|jgi:3'(2'), 5'-bisphosphate nucleotidase|nr:3'(2'),5'-bisphosphate nucleotidase CysQ [Bacteroidia bacterium]